MKIVELDITLKGVTDFVFWANGKIYPQGFIEDKSIYKTRVSGEEDFTEHPVTEEERQLVIEAVNEQYEQEIIEQNKFLRKEFFQV
jgi:hypothetical protein